MHLNQTSKNNAFALVTTLVILVLLVIVVAGFLVGIQSERNTSRAFANAAQADLAAQAGVAEGIAILRAHFEQHPDSATTWENILVDTGTATQGTVLYYRKHKDAAGTAIPFDPAKDALFLHPLISGAAAMETSANGQPVSTIKLAHADKDWRDADNSVDLNRKRWLSDEQGWIGSPLNAARQPIRVPWVEMREVPGDANSRVIARYAFWIEDESFKVNINLTGSNTRGSKTPGIAPEEIPLQPLLAYVGSEEPDTNAAAILALRKLFPKGRLLEVAAVNHAEITTGSSASLSELLKFETTLFSSSLNLSRNGFQRLNLNAVVSGSAETPAEIRQQLDEIIVAIKRQLPNFGTRFFLNEQKVSEENQNIYLQKIAANIRDYIDADSQPALIKNDGTKANGWRYTVVDASAPSEPIQPEDKISGKNPYAAIGKENIPYVQEFAVRATLHELNPPSYRGSNNPGANFRFNLDYYFEFWNMTGKDISVAKGDLGTHPFIQVCNQMGFDTDVDKGGTRIDAGRPFKILLSGSGVPNIVFPAGKCTVITTDAAWSRKLIPSANANVIVCPVTDPPNACYYAGRTYRAITDTEHGFRVNSIARDRLGDPRPGTGANYGKGTDYWTGMFLGNDKGLLDSMFALPIGRKIPTANATITAISLRSDIAGTLGSESTEFIRGGSLVGNAGGALEDGSIVKGAGQSGDPRTNNEQLALVRNDNTAGYENSRYYFSGLDTDNVPAQSSLGKANTNFVKPAGGSGVSAWPDAFEWSTLGVDMPMVIANAPMKSIGELGHIFDPAREVGASGKIEWSRGGGRTLMIGQPDPIWNKDSRSEAREQAAWRLTDIFCTTDELQQEGRININGIRRDNGVALKAALYQYAFENERDSDSLISGKLLSKDALNALVEQLRDRLDNRDSAEATAGPMAERGELSELPLFSKGRELADNVDAEKITERGREELFRRLVELTTTRGNTFSIYVIGQAIQQTPQGKLRATATHQTKVIFRLEPKWTTPPTPTFDPSKDADARFSKPDRYVVKILQATGE